MATVRITQRVVEDIRGEIIQQFAKRQRALTASHWLSSGETESFLRRVIDLWLEQHGSSRADFERLPKDSFPTTSRNRISYINGVRVSELVEQFELPTPMHVPQPFSSWSGMRIEINEHRDEVVKQIMDQARNYDEQTTAISNERAKVVESVTKILSVFPTLNKAVEYWPPLVELLPTRLRERLEEKVERKKVAEIAADQLNDISLDNLNVSLVKNKLATV